jgi:hypothetical protein
MMTLTDGFSGIFTELNIQLKGAVESPYAVPSSHPMQGQSQVRAKDLCAASRTSCTSVARKIRKPRVMTPAFASSIVNLRNVISSYPYGRRAINWKSKSDRMRKWTRFVIRRI